MTGSVITKFLIAVAWTALCLSAATAQPFVTGPVTIVVAFPAGGADDALGRVVATNLSKILNQPVNVENISGRGGMIGSLHIARAPANGSQILLGSSATHAVSQALYRSPLYDSIADFEPIALLAEQPIVLLARKSLAARDIKEFAAYAKSNAVQYGSAGVGSATHIACARLSMAIGSDAKHAPYNGGGPAMQDLIAGLIDFFCPVITIAIPQVKAQTVKVIATLGSVRSPTLSDVPTAQEQGLKDFTATTWFALFAPKGTPASVVDGLNKAVALMLDSPSVQSELMAIGANPVDADRRSPGYLRSFLASEISKYAAALRSAGIQLD